MRLINFGAGELADRLTILSLKLLHAPEGGAEHFRHEQVALLAKLRAGNGLAGYVEELIELAAVNGALWRAEDDLRRLRQVQQKTGGLSLDEAQAVVQVAFRIQELNDRRAALREAINTKTGEHFGREKI